jgi:cytochrome P450
VGPPGIRATIYVISSAEGARQVLATQAANFRKESVFYNEIRQSIGNGLLTSQDADYLGQRRLVQPLFTRRRIDGYATAVGREALALVARWDAVPGGMVDVIEEMSDFVLRTAARILFGADATTVTDVVRRDVSLVTGYIARRTFAPVRIPRRLPTPGNRRATAAQTEMYAVCDRIIAQRRGADPDEQTEDLLSLLQTARGENGESLDPTEVRNQVLIFLVAGHETTATSLGFTLHLLATHPEVQTRARAEVDAVLGDRTPEATDMDALPYLTMVSKEAMRLYPAASVISRRSAAECEIDGHRMPAGSDILIAPWVTHRNPDLWPDPDRFDPERFTPQQEADRHRYAWFPFGGGPRACIGQHLAMLESVLTLATLLSHFQFDPVDTVIPVSQGVTLRAAGPARCRITSTHQPNPRR